MKKKIPKAKIPKFPEGGEFGWAAAIVRNWAEVLVDNGSKEDADTYFRLAEKLEEGDYDAADLECALMVLWQELAE